MDIHCHAVSTRAEELVRPHQRPSLRTSCIDEATRTVSQRHHQACLPQLTGLQRRLQDMDRDGIDVQVLSPSPGHYGYALDAEVGRAAARMVNDDIAELVARAPQRLAGMGTVPLQDPTMAIAEMRRCVRELGLRGIMIDTNVDGRELAHDGREAFFAAAQALGVVLFLHPMTYWTDARFGSYHLSNLVGNPLDSTMALSHLVFGGVLDRLPGLKLCVAHGGGFLPTYLGRLDHGWHARPDCRAHAARPPSEYLRRLYFDTVVFDPEHLAWLVRRFGAGQVLLGTDYPFDMAEPDPHGLLARAPGLGEDERAQVAGLNAVALFGLQAMLPH